MIDIDFNDSKASLRAFKEYNEMYIDNVFKETFYKKTGFHVYVPDNKFSNIHLNKYYFLEDKDLKKIMLESGKKDVQDITFEDIQEYEPILFYDFISQELRFRTQNYYDRIIDLLIFLDIEFESWRRDVYNDMIIVTTCHNGNFESAVVNKGEIRNNNFISKIKSKIDGDNKDIEKLIRLENYEISDDIHCVLISNNDYTKSPGRDTYSDKIKVYF